jgi:hypothetical protein
MLKGAIAVPTVIVNNWVAVCGVEEESFSCTENEEFPAWVGVPERTPLEDARLMPGGSWPVVTVQV